ncbi:MAG: hypothetical protein JF606_15020 [Burkholderiales bacterium]|jgi:hypothetical protein|nr:hypothetical protein [Burkholderiales bacterium]
MANAAARYDAQPYVDDTERKHGCVASRFDEAYEQIQILPDGPQRLALLREALNIVTALAPHKYNVHLTDLSQPWLIGYRRPLYGRQCWQYVDIDEASAPGNI